MYLVWRLSTILWTERNSNPFNVFLTGVWPRREGNVSWSCAVRQERFAHSWMGAEDLWTLVPWSAGKRVEKHSQIYTFVSMPLLCPSCPMYLHGAWIRWKVAFVRFSRRGGLRLAETPGSWSTTPRRWTTSPMCLPRRGATSKNDVKTSLIIKLWLPGNPRWMRLFTTAWLIFFWISTFTLFFCLVLDGGALSRHLVPKKADEENSRQGVQAGQGEEQQVQFIDRVEKKWNGKFFLYVVL